MARGPRNITFEPKDKSTEEALPIHWILWRITEGGRWGLKLERVQGYLDKVTQGSRRLWRRKGAVLNGGKAKVGLGLKAFGVPLL